MSIKRAMRIAGLLSGALYIVGTMASPVLAQEPAMVPAPERSPSDGVGPFSKMVIRGATLIDGTGGPPRGPVDIVIEHNQITDVINAGTPACR